jgi:hypothetical protein
MPAVYGDFFALEMWYSGSPLASRHLGKMQSQWTLIHTANDWCFPVAGAANIIALI